MSIQQDITERHKWFSGEDKILEFEVLEDDGRDVIDANTPARDVSGEALEWVLRRLALDADPPLLRKATGGLGITISGVFNVSRASNTQRVLVAVASGDTVTFTRRKYRHALGRIDAGQKGVYADGEALLLVEATRLS